MQVGDWLKKATQQLQQAGIGTARLDCLVLLEDTLNNNRTHLIAHPEEKIGNEQLMYLQRAVTRRMTHEPLAYIRGRTEFYGREFIVNKHVLEPRPESEGMISLLKDAALPAKSHLADVGTGSGALGITAKLEMPSLHVDLIEMDEQALTVTKKNVNKFNVSVTCILSDLLTSTSQRYDVILANLPYVPDNFQINPAALMEPRIAIFGGPDGLDLYRRLFIQIGSLKRQPRLIFTESLPPQHDTLAAIGRQAGYELSRTENFIQQFDLKPPPQRSSTH